MNEINKSGYLRVGDEIAVTARTAALCSKRTCPNQIGVVRPFNAVLHNGYAPALSAILTLNQNGGAMTMNMKLTSLAIIAATLAASITASAQTATRDRPCPTCRNYCPLRRVAGGDLADCRGWRFVNGHWNSSCFNLDYLPSQYACSPNSRP
jgi:hypothetical protein